MAMFFNSDLFGLKNNHLIFPISTIHLLHKQSIIMTLNKEQERLNKTYLTDKGHENWLEWGPYLSERQWGTVREDYSSDGNAWDYFPHDHARSRAYRWGEDGLAGISDPKQKLCFALSLWNGNDAILKERLFGLTNGEGNHGEDVKEYYFYQDNTPTHSYMKWLYKYPQKAYPYQDLVDENARRKQFPESMEYELIDTGVFEEDRYFDVQVEYAKSATEDVLIKIKVTNHGPDKAPIHLLPTLWFRNTWSWFFDVQPPVIEGSMNGKVGVLKASADTEKSTDEMALYCQDPDQLFFVDNETNSKKLFNAENKTQYPKDGINDHLIHGTETVNPALKGSKSSAYYFLELEGGETKEINLRFTSDLEKETPFGDEFEKVFADRITEADAFYEQVSPSSLSEDQKMIQRQAYAGMLWSKQYYLYVVSDWLKGDPKGPKPPENRSRNKEWSHFYADNILTMPDKWEYPWFAAWDLCFQTVVFSRIDIEFAKNQLLFLSHEWYMSPKGAIPAYEWSFSDINPPLHAWAALKIYEIEKETKGDEADSQFLADVFRHCLMNFTWWVNQVDHGDNNLFEGGFLGLDNISILNRSDLSNLEKRLGVGVEMNQSDGTSWVGMFCLNMMEIANILSVENHSEYSHLVSKFFQHFIFVADAMNMKRTECNIQLWNDEDEFYYDFLTVHDQPTKYHSVKLRSLVGVIALFPVAAIDFSELEIHSAKSLKDRLQWFIEKHPELLEQVKTTDDDDQDKLLLSFANPERLVKVLLRVFDELEFLSPHGIRGISKVYEESPYTLDLQRNNVKLQECYAPAESLNQAFGGNSNWRGPVWFPINFLLIETLQKYHKFLGEDFTIEYPSKSGNQKNLLEISNDLSKRLIGIFEKDQNGNRPVFGGNKTFQKDEKWNNNILFYEYFHGDIGAGIGASHQTGWTGLVAELLQNIK